MQSLNLLPKSTINIAKKLAQTSLMLISHASVNNIESEESPFQTKGIDDGSLIW